MVRQDRKIYLANVWSELVTERGIKLFQNKGWSVTGNWLNGAKVDPSFNVIISPPASFDGAELISQKDFPKSRVFLYLLFPDEMVGWNLIEKKYKLTTKYKFCNLFANNYLPIFSHSKFTANLVTSTYHETKLAKTQVIYLPIDHKFLSKPIKRMNKKINVLWNHEWRSDKGVIDAFTIINNLSEIYPNVMFYIGKNERWGSRRDVKLVKKEAELTLLQLNKKNNIIFVDTIYKHLDYMNFLKIMDIGFSTSYHEGFGLSMAEQAAAGIACVVPKEEAYPEILPDSLLVKRSKIEQSIRLLIEDQKLRLDVGNACQKNAANYDVDIWINNLITVIERYL